jgi:C1A family cysteine protease
MPFALICLILTLFLIGIFRKNFQKKAFALNPFCLVLSLIAILGLGLNVNASDEIKGRGLKPLTAEDIQNIEQNSHWIIKVHPNKIGAARIQEHLKKNGKKPIKIATKSHDEEVVLNHGLTQETVEKIQSSISDHPLPYSVDNTLLHSFPPIGDQQQLGSCVAWGSTYYQATHEYGLLNGINNKNASAHILSPKWTYNLLNNGEDNGLNPPDTFKLLSQNGAATLTAFPYDSNYLQWDLHAKDWIAAISRRMTPARMISGIGGSQPQNLHMIKQLLNNGHILTFATFVDSWVYTTVKEDPANPNSPAVGQQAVAWMNGSNGGHYLTIVGYNDDIWIDVNGDNKVDTGEKGAFLIANSWSDSWGNNGLIWISYDAFLSQSAVKNGPNDGRVPLADAMNSYVVSISAKSPNYQPKLLAQFTLSQSERNQVFIGAGSSDVNQKNPSQKFSSGALVNQGGLYEFNGKAADSPEKATFALDLTDLIPSEEDSKTQRFYLILGANKVKEPTTLTSFSLLDNVHQKHIDYENIPLVCDNKNLTPYIDYSFSGKPAEDESPPVVNITSPLEGDVVRGLVNLTVNATSNSQIKKVEFYINSVVQKSVVKAPYVTSLDLSHLPEGTHKISAIAYDVSNKRSKHTISVNLQSYPAKIAINAGGNIVDFKGIVWEKDHDYTKPSGVYSTLLNFANHVYRTERNGHFSYRINVANGSHNVRLKFAELRYRAVGKRVFNVIINGVQVITNLDLVETAGYGIAFDQIFPVDVTDNLIDIEFIPVVNKAKVNAIEITTN